jgi:hypothetical protein
VTKYCKDCKWCGQLYSLGSRICTSDVMCGHPDNAKVDLVSGQSHPAVECVTLRAEGRWCGPEAAHFEPQAEVGIELGGSVTTETIKPA